MVQLNKEQEGAVFLAEQQHILFVGARTNNIKSMMTLRKERSAIWHSPIVNITKKRKYPLNHQLVATLHNMLQ